MPKVSSSGIKHTGIQGRRSTRWPEINWSEVADRTGITRSYMSYIIGGYRGPSLRVAIRLAEVLGITVEDLEKKFLNGNGNKRKPKRPKRKVKRRAA